MQVNASIRAITRRGISAGLVTAMATGLALSAQAPARAESLDEQHKRLEQALAQSKAALEGKSQAVVKANDALTQSQAELADRQQVLANAREAYESARSTDALLAARLAAAQDDLDRANAAVEKNTKALNREIKLARVSLSELQQTNPLQPLGVLTQNLRTADVNQRQQWAQVSAEQTQQEAARLGLLQEQLKQAREQQAKLTADVEQQRKAAAAHLDETTQLRDSAAAQQQAIAALVENNSKAAIDARAQAQAEQDRADALEAKAATVADQLRAQEEARRVAAAKAAEARRQAAAAAARKKAAEQKARQIAAAKAAKLAAEREAARQAALEKAAQEEAERQAAAEAKAEKRAEVLRAKKAAAKKAAAAAARKAAAKKAASTTSTKSTTTRSYNLADRSPAASSSGKVSSNAWTADTYYDAVSASEVDPWGFYSWECVSYAAYKVRTTTRYNNFVNNYSLNGNSVHFGNAVEWAAAARGIGVRVDTTPTVGSIAWRASGRAGHVAYVTAVHSDGTIDISEYNFASYHTFGTRHYVAWWQGGGAGFDGFIHFEG